MSPFNYVFLLGALFVSSVVGYHSVLGFVSSFGTSYLFAISLETAKLLVVSFVSRYYTHLSPLHKFFGWLFVACLISVSSFGIFGYLTHDMTSRVLQVQQLTDSYNKAQEDLRTLSTQVQELERLRNAEIERQSAVSTRTDLSKTRDRVFEQFGSQISTLTAKRDAVAASVNKLRNDMNESARHSSTVSNVANVFGIGVNDALLYVAFLVTAIFDPVAVYLFTLYGKSVNIHTQRKEDVALSAYSSYAEQTDLRITELDKQVSLKLEEHAEKVAVALDLANRAHTEAFTHRDEINLLHKQVS